MNRLARDTLLLQALDLADLPTLDAHDRPAGTIVAGAFSIVWLQDALDLFHNQFPLAATVKGAPITIAAGQNQVAVPADFILDVRHGIVIPQSANAGARRLIRTSYQKLLTYLTYSTGQGAPRRYAVMGPNVLFWPVADVAYAATLNYYAMPATLNAGDTPTFPSDQILIDLVKLRALEWARQEQPGTALAYARREIAKIRAAGLFNQAEDTEIPLDPDQFVNAEQTPWSWMGPFSQQT